VLLAAPAVLVLVRRRAPARSGLPSLSRG
jgi:hypothetical protein